MSRHFFILLALIGATCFVYWGVWNFDFIEFDDPQYITENARIADGLTASNIGWSFRTNYFYNWHPLTWLTYFADATLYGTGARGFHISNLILHLCATLALYAALFELSRNQLCSAFVAAAFGVHPLHVESVAWISERKDVLSALFGFLAIWSFARYAHRKRAGFYWLSLAFFALSLLAKQMLVTLPFLLLLLDYWPLGRLQSVQSAGTGTGGTATKRHLLVELIPFFSLAAASSVVAFWAQQASGSVASLQQTSLSVRAANAVHVYVIYLGKIFWPANLAAFYPMPADEPLMFDVALAAGLLAVVTVIAVVTVRRWPYLAVGWFWYLGTLVPVIGLVQIGDQRMADRYTYIPAVGIFIGVSWWAYNAIPAGRARQWAFGAVAVCAVVGLSIAGRAQAAHWQNSITLFTHTLAVTEPNARTEFNLGVVYEKQKQLDAAATHYRSALAILPEFAPAYFNLGNVAFAQQRPDEALEQYDRALEFDPQHASAHHNRGNALAALGRMDEAVGAYRKCLELEPDNAKAHGNLATALYQLNRYDESLAEFAEAARLAPESPTAHFNYALALGEQRRIEEAVAELELAAQVAPKSASFLNNLGVAFIRFGRPEQAAQQFHAALEVDPTYVEAERNLQRLQGSGN